MGCPISAAFFSAAAITRRASAKLTIVSPLIEAILLSVVAFGPCNYTSPKRVADLLFCIQMVMNLTLQKATKKQSAHRRMFANERFQEGRDETARR
jgi:hypothetical protein